MNAVTEISGKLLAKKVVAKAKAVEALSQREHSLTTWQLVSWCVVGGVQGFFVAKNVNVVGTEVIGATAGAALFLAAAAFKECINLRRKLAAVIVLLQQDQAR